MCPDQLPSAETAWEFINESLYIDDGIERPAGLPERLPRQFKHDYYRHLRNLANERAAAAKENWGNGSNY